MRKLAGELIDIYDDPQGTVFKKRFPDPDLLPEFIKEASLLTPEEKEALPEHLFALVLQDGDRSMRKYARNDKANTALSIVYLLDSGASRLTPKLVKTAAQNLVQACEWYRLEVPEALQKLATVRPTAGDYIEPRVDITKTAAVVAPETQHYAMPSKKKYPLDSYQQTQTSFDFFEKHASRLHPLERREFALNAAGRAKELAIPLTRDMEIYSSNKLADEHQVAQQVKLRMEKTSGLHQQKYAVFYEKLGSVSPGGAAAALATLDEDSGLDSMWDGALMDPWSAMLQEDKVAEYYQFVDTTGSVSEDDLKDLANTQETFIKKALGDDFFKPFWKDPVGVFKSLPLDEKRVIIRLCASKTLS